MKIRVVCPGCNDFMEKDIEENEVLNNMVVCGKCKVPAVIHNADTGEVIAGGAPCMPGLIICAENSDVQAFVPAGSAREKIIQSLRAIADAIESDGEMEGFMIAQVNIVFQEDKMIIIRRSPECSEGDIDKRDIDKRDASIEG